MALTKSIPAVNPGVANASNAESSFRNVVILGHGGIALLIWPSMMGQCEKFFKLIRFALTSRVVVNEVVYTLMDVHISMVYAQKSKKCFNGCEKLSAN